jgi:hypothetical protein
MTSGLCARLSQIHRSPAWCDHSCGPCAIPGTLCAPTKPCLLTPDTACVACPGLVRPCRNSLTAAHNMQNLQSIVATTVAALNAVQTAIAGS